MPSRRASRTGLSLDLGRALETMRRCRQTMAMPVNFAFLVPQAIMKGLAKLTLCESSVISQ